MDRRTDANIGKQSILVVSAVTAVCLLGDSMLYVVLPIYWDQAGLHSIWEAGVLLSINRLVRLPLNPLIGWLYHRIALRTGLLVAVAIAAATTLGYGLLEGFGVWIVLRVVWGAAWSFIRMGGYFTVIGYADDFNRGHYMGRFNGISRLGSLFGMLVGGILASWLGLQATAVIFATIGMIGFLFILVYMPKHKKEKSVPIQSSFKKTAVHLHSGPVILILGGSLLISMLLAGMNSTLSLVIARNYGEFVWMFGIAIGTTALSGALLAMRYTWDFSMSAWIGRKSDQAGSRLSMVVVALLCCGIAHGLISWQAPLAVWIAIVMVAMLASTAINTLMDTVASDVAKSTSTIAVMTAYSVTTDLGAALGPAVSLWIVGWTGKLDYIYIGIAALFFIIAFAIRTSRYYKIAI